MYISVGNWFEVVKSKTDFSCLKPIIENVDNSPPLNRVQPTSRRIIEKWGDEKNEVVLDGKQAITDPITGAKRLIGYMLSVISVGNLA